MTDRRFSAAPPSSALPAGGDRVELAQRLAAADVLQRYVWGVDHKRWEHVRRCFHDDAVDHHAGRSAPVADFKAWVRRRHEHVVEAVHAMSNIVVGPLDDGRLATEASCALYQGMTAECGETLAAYGLGAVADLPVAPPAVPGPGVAVEMTGLCRYTDILEDRPGAGWRIAERRVAFVRNQAMRLSTVDKLE